MALFPVSLFVLPFSSLASHTLRFRIPTDPTSIDWHIASSSAETYIIMNLMEGLVEVGNDLNPRPNLAEKWDISPDGKTYTFSIRPDAKWSDGVPLTAKHFYDSWVRLLSPATQSPSASFLDTVKGAKAFRAGKVPVEEFGIKHDGLTFTVELEDPVTHFLFLPSFWITFPIRKDLIDQDPEGWASPEKIVTLGPYLLKRWKRGKELVLRKNDRYYAYASIIDAPQAVKSIVSDDQMARRLFRNGEIDILLNAKTGDLISLPADARVQRFPYLSTWYLGFSRSNEFFGTD